MSFLKKIIAVKTTLFVVSGVLFFVILFSIITAIAGSSMGAEVIYDDLAEIRTSSVVKNNQLYAERYRSILKKYLINKGYVSLERMVFYLQRTNNVLDITSLSNEVWENAYLSNLNDNTKQMIPIKTICKNIKSNKSLPLFNISSGTNSNGVQIDVIDLCNINGVDITTSKDYTEGYSYMPFTFPIRRSFGVTSMVFEYRNVSINVPALNFHTGWDFSVPIGTDFYSVCDGNVRNIVNTQFNDLPYGQSLNQTGNYITVNCSNGLIVGYYHIKSNSIVANYNRVGAIVKEGTVLGKTSTTGMSTGPHLHLELKDSSGTVLDAMNYMDFTKYEGN